jgi:hypothetical protein
MAEMKLDIAALRAKYSNLSEAEQDRIINEITAKFYAFGKRFPYTSLHDRSVSKWDVPDGRVRRRAYSRVLVLSGIPDEVIHEAWAEILPALPEHTPELPDGRDSDQTD